MKLDDEGIGLNETLELTDVRSVNAFATFLAGADDVRALKDSVTGVKDELEEIINRHGLTAELLF